MILQFTFKTISAGNLQFNLNDDIIYLSPFKHKFWSSLCCFETYLYNKIKETFKIIDFNVIEIGTNSITYKIEFSQTEEPAVSVINNLLV